jgi:hypothetical protein
MLLSVPTDQQQMFCTVAQARYRQFISHSPLSLGAYVFFVNNLNDLGYTAPCCLVDS